jgi:prepilin signal peptidase PulO-like enzyme (type II secretory pathway)
MILLILSFTFGFIAGALLGVKFFHYLDEQIIKYSNCPHCGLPLSIRKQP